MDYKLLICASLACVGICSAQNRPGAGTGAPAISISHSGDRWTLAGTKNRADFNASNLAVSVHAGPAVWNLLGSSTGDLLIAAGGDEFRIGLAEAGRIAVTTYDTGFKSGIKVVLDGFRAGGLRAPGSPLDVRVVLTMCLEGGDEDLVFEAMVNESGAPR